MNHFEGKQFQNDVIIVAVGYYLRYNISYREVQDILYIIMAYMCVIPHVPLGTGIWEAALHNLEKEKYTIFLFLQNG